MQSESDPAQTALDSTALLRPEASLDGVIEGGLDWGEEIPDFSDLLDGLAAASNHGVRAARAATAHKGRHETPCGSNKNPYSTYFGYGAQAWCADFVSWAFDATGDRNRRVPWGYPSSVANLRSWGSRSGYLLDAPRVGAVFAYSNNQHVGLVTRVSKNTFETVEGNTSGPDGRVCWVWSHVREVGGPYTYIRVPD